jgi:probable HAF family extracellular repeat protein
VSADGSVVVGSSVSFGQEAFRWTEATGMVGLADLPGGGFYSSAIGASADGAVVVGESHTASGLEAFRWTEATGMVGLGDLPGGSFFSSAIGASADGAVVVGTGASAAGQQEAFRWTQVTGMVGLGDLPGGSFLSNAQGVSADGAVVVGYSFSAAGNEAFLWDAVNGMRNLREVLTAQGADLTGWTLQNATGVAVAPGGTITIVGTGTNPAGQLEAWLARL